MAWNKRNVDIAPSQTFFLPAAQEVNKQQLLEILGAAEPVLEEIAKVDKNTWTSMKGLFQSMEKAGSSLLGNFGGRLRSAAMTPFNALMNPLANTFESLLMPLNTMLMPMVNSYQSYLMRSQGSMTGAAIGAGIGFIAGNFLPGGQIWAPLLGAGVGAFFGGLGNGPGIAPGAGELKELLELGYGWMQILNMDDVTRETITEYDIVSPQKQMMQKIRDQLWHQTSFRRRAQRRARLLESDPLGRY